MTTSRELREMELGEILASISPIQLQRDIDIDHVNEMTKWLRTRYSQPPPDNFDLWPPIILCENLSFNSTNTSYIPTRKYVLDGQHRLAAWKNIGDMTRKIPVCLYLMRDMIAIKEFWDILHRDIPLPEYIRDPEQSSRILLEEFKIWLHSRIQRTTKITLVSQSIHPRRPNIHINNIIMAINKSKIHIKYNTVEQLAELFEKENIILREKYESGELNMRVDLMSKAIELNAYWGCDPTCTFLDKYVIIPQNVIEDVLIDSVDDKMESVSLFARGGDDVVSGGVASHRVLSVPVGVSKLSIKKLKGD